MINAMKAVTEKKMTIRGAAKKFNVPYRCHLFLVPSHALSVEFFMNLIFEVRYDQMVFRCHEIKSFIVS